MVKPTWECAAEGTPASINYHWPGEMGADERAQREEPVSMVGTGLLQNFLPSTVPIAASIEFSASYNVNDDPDTEKFSAGAPAINLLFGAAYGDHVSL